MYRVYFWWRRGPQAHAMWHCQEHRMRGARDVGEVLRWAGEHAEGRTAVVYVEALDEGRLGLVRLQGQDFNAAAAGGDGARAATGSG